MDTLSIAVGCYSWLLNSFNPEITESLFVCYIRTCVLSILCVHIWIKLFVCVLRPGDGLRWVGVSFLPSLPKQLKKAAAPIIGRRHPSTSTLRPRWKWCCRSGSGKNCKFISTIMTTNTQRPIHTADHFESPLSNFYDIAVQKRPIGFPKIAQNVASTSFSRTFSFFFRFYRSTLTRGLCMFSFTSSSVKVDALFFSFARIRNLTCTVIVDSQVQWITNAMANSAMEFRRGCWPQKWFQGDSPTIDRRVHSSIDL